MPRTGVSVTLQHENLLWLKSQTLSAKTRSVSETLDALVTAARTSGQASPDCVRSIVGTVDIAEDDPNLERADASVAQLMKASITRPVLVRQAAGPRYGATKARRRG